MRDCSSLEKMHQTACMHALGGHIQQLCWLISPSEKRRSRKATSHMQLSTNSNQRRVEIKVNIFFVTWSIGNCDAGSVRGKGRVEINDWLCVIARQNSSSCIIQKEHESSRPRCPGTKATSHASLSGVPAPVCLGSGCIPGAFVAVRASDWIRWLEKLESLLLVTHGSQRWPLLVWSRSECSCMSWVLWSDFCFFVCNRSQTLPSALIHSTKKENLAQYVERMCWLCCTASLLRDYCTRKAS